jgi:hypothetical protein
MELRCQARWLQRLEHPSAWPPRSEALWGVHDHLPRWLQSVARPISAGIFQVPGKTHTFLWFAANALPLRADLLPLLVARSGLAQAEFVTWAAQVKGPEWVLQLLKEVSMSAKTIEALKQSRRGRPPGQRFLFDPDVIEEILEARPDVRRALAARLGRQKGLEQGREQGLAMLHRQFTRKLGRRLLAKEKDLLSTRLDKLGPNRLGDVVLDLTPARLEAWLANPRAR